MYDENGTAALVEVGTVRFDSGNTSQPPESQRQLFPIGFEPRDELARALDPVETNPGGQSSQHRVFRKQALEAERSTEGGVLFARSRRGKGGAAKRPENAELERERLRA